MTNERESFRTAGGRPPKMTKAQESRVEAASKRIAGRTGAGAGGDRTPSGHSGEGGAISGALAAIQERANAATEGPWRYTPVVLGVKNTTVMAGDEQVGYFSVGQAMPTDATFIAHARTDVEWMARALQAVVEAHQPDDVSACTACGSNESGLAIVKYPCPTIRAIEQALEVGNE